jgi:CheY-specific phosphatase CheX
MTMNQRSTGAIAEAAPAHLEVLKASVKTTFGAICGSEPVFNEPEVVADRSGVLGIIAVVGDLSWSLTLGFPPATAEALATQFAGFEIPFDSPDMGDVIGELANVLAGDLVAKLEGVGVGVKMSLPTVARGQDVDTVQGGSVTTYRMGFTTPQGRGWLGLAIATKKN